MERCHSARSVLERLLMIGRWLREGRLWAVAAMVIVAALLPTTTVAAPTFIYDAQSNARVDAQMFGRAEASPTQLSDVREGSASPVAKGASTTPSGAVVATKAAGGGKPFAMGIEDHLDEFASQHGATTWKQLEDPSNWKPGVFDKLSDPDQRVLFNLDDVDVQQGLTRAAAGRGGARRGDRLGVADDEAERLSES
jgi:hypothetical protein